MSILYFDNVVQVGQLYLEHVFFEFEKEPILFTCHDQLNQIYLCLCSDIRYGQKWIIAKCNTKILRALITTEIDIVTAFLEQQEAIVVDMDMKGTEKSYKVNIQDLNDEMLPDNGIFLKVHNKKNDNYIAPICNDHMNTILNYKGYHAFIKYDSDDEIFVGEILGITDSLSFHGSSMKELEEMFHNSIDNYIMRCQKINKIPEI